MEVESMITYYSIMFAITAIIFTYFLCRYENRKTNYYYVSLIILMVASNAGYLAVALSKTVEEAVLGTKILYLGACFVQPVTLSLICTLANFKINSLLNILNYGPGLIVYAMVLSIGYSSIYYENVYIKTYGDATVVGHTYGIGHSVFYVVLICHTLVEVGLIAYALGKKRAISRKNLIGLLAIEIVNIYIFVMGTIISSSVEVMPITYACSSIILVYMYQRGLKYNFEDNVMNAQKEIKNAYIMFDERMNFLGANEVAEEIFPQLKESVVDSHLDNGIESQNIIGWIYKCQEEGIKTFEYKTQNAHYDCEVRYLYHNDQFCGYMIEMRDNTDSWKYGNLLSSHNEELQREIEKQMSISEELRIAKIEAESANEAKSQFLARMSHEIRTPINAVMGMNDIIIRDSKEEEIKKRAFDIKSATNTLLGLINEILDSSKIDAGMMEIIPESYEMASFLNDLYNMVYVKAKSKNLKLIFDIDPNLPRECYGDDIRIKQVLVNLLSNAVKYTSEGSVTLHLSCDIVGSHIWLHYKVIDTGVGIKEEDFKKLFGKFERIEESKHRNIEGTGLGLNIAYRLLSLMGSELKVKSEYQKGSEFYFDIKQKIVDIEPLGEFEKSLKIVEESENYQMSFVAPDAKVLVVDDNEMNRSVFKGILEPTQVQVYEASSGEECIAMLQNRKFHMVFLDHMMPGLDGIETFHIIKKKKLCEETPVIMFTANVMTGERERYLNLGFKNFLAKPISADLLEEMVVKYLPKELVQEKAILKTAEKNQDIENLPILEEFDFKYAMGMLRSEELLMQSLANFRDLLKYIPEKLEYLMASIEDEAGLNAYRIEVHALKGTAATVGALLLSKLARILEVAAANGEIEKIHTLQPILLEEIEKHLERVETLFPEERKEIESIELLSSYLDMLYMGVAQGDYDTADFMMEELKKYRYSEEIQDLIDELTGQVLNLEMSNAMETIEKIKNSL